MKFFLGGARGGAQGGTRRGAHRGTRGGAQGDSHGSFLGGAHGKAPGGTRSGSHGYYHGGGTHADTFGGQHDVSPLKRSAKQEEDHLQKVSNPRVREGVLYVDVTKSPPPLGFFEAYPQENLRPGPPERRRSQTQHSSCKRCLRQGHTTDECRHQLTCRRCSGAGHIAARCPLKSPLRNSTSEPLRKKIRSKRTHLEAKPITHVPGKLKDSLLPPVTPEYRVSLPFTEAIIKSKEDLKKMAVISIISGNASVNSLSHAIPNILNPANCGDITPFDDCFLLSMSSARALTTAVKKGPISFNSTLGPCTICISPWSPEFSSHGLAAGDYHWILLSNLPLHCWNWDSIVSVLRPIGDLIYVQKREESSLKHLRVLARLKSSISFPMSIIVDVGFRSFVVELEDSGIPTLRSKIVRAKQSLSSAGPSNPDSAAPTESHRSSSARPSEDINRGTHLIPRELKGKQTVAQDVPMDEDVEPSGKTVEPCSGLGPSTMNLSSNLIRNMDISEHCLAPDERQLPSATVIPPAADTSAEKGDKLCTSSTVPRDKLFKESFVFSSLSASLHRDQHSADDNQILPLNSTGFKSDNKELPADHTNPKLGDNINSAVIQVDTSTAHEDMSNHPSKSKALPCHLRSLPPPMAIPEGYQWIVLDGGWTLIPNVNADKFNSPVIPSQSPSTPIRLPQLDSNEDELVDLGEDDDQDLVVDDFEDDDQILENASFHNEPLENISGINEDFPLNEDSHADTVSDILISRTENDIDIHGENSEAPPNLRTIQIRHSDCNKKPSTRWNEESGFISHPPRSAKKKIPDDPKGGYALLARFVAAPLIVCGFLSYKFRKMISSVDNVESFLRMQNILIPTRYAYTDIIALTSHFKEKLGQGGFASVFKGRLPGDRLIAIKMLSNYKSNGEDFINEVSTIGRTHHVNVVRLIGFCSDGSHRALVYEYMANGSLDKFIFSSNNGFENKFSSEKLTEIALGIARGIDYLHQGCDMQIVHFDIKPQNILLDQNFIPKISDFGLAKLYPRDYNFASISVVRGTIGYIAPEVFSRSFGFISHKCDVYGFGMLLLEMASRRRNYYPGEENTSQVYYPSWIYDKLNNPMDHGDQESGTGVAKFVISDSEKKLCMIGLWCIQMRPSGRPSMSKVVEMLEGDVDDLQMPPNPFFSDLNHYPAILSLPCPDILQEELSTSSDDIVSLV